MRRTLLCAALGVSLLAAPVAAHAEEKVPAAEGVPALGQPWTADDYLRAAGALKAGKAALPLVSDEQGRRLLDRLTAVENLSVCRDEALPLDTRLTAFSRIMAGASGITTQYSEAAKQGAAVHTECARMMAFLLRTAAVGAHLVDELIPTLPRDGKYAARMDGLTKLRTGTAKMFTGAETSLAEQTFYSVPDLSLLLDAMAETLPALKQGFPDGYNLALARELEVDKARFSQPGDTQNFQKMLAELEN